MHYQTKNKIGRINEFIQSNYKRWVRRYPDIVGVHIGKKVRGGETLPNYSIVFHVTRKKRGRTGRKMIPGHFAIKVGRKMVDVPTDVIESGKPQLSELQPGIKVFDKKTPASIGSAGIFLRNKAADIFLLTNMHVIGKTHLRQTFEIFDVAHDFTNPEIRCRLEDESFFDIACFKSGCVDEFLDAAIAILHPDFHDLVENIVDGKPVLAADQVDMSVAAQPRPVLIRGAMSGLVGDIAINANTAIRAFTYPLDTVVLNGLLQISPCKTKGGDSGSPIVDANTNELLGIVVGKDARNTFTYGIPIDRILNLFELTILKPAI